jgi:hypothetical protein
MFGGCANPNPNMHGYISLNVFDIDNIFLYELPL